MRRENKQRTLPPAGHFAIKPGTKVRVTNDVMCYPLPKGLEPGEVVVILSFDRGSYKVQRGEDGFTINSSNIVGKLVGHELRWDAIIES